jgi:multicomponent Na+:H+ antiporter subunit B
MNSLILRTATRFLIPLLLIFSIFLLLRGHNEPGGGFVGGLVAASAFVLYTISHGVDATLDALWADPHRIIGVGLLVTLLSAIVPLFSGLPFLTAQWSTLTLPGNATLELGTTFFFDLGVYITVFGVTLMIILALARE